MGIIRFEVANDYDIIISQHGRVFLLCCKKSERKCQKEERDTCL